MNKYAIYERKKRELQALPPKEYEREIKKLIRELKL